MKQKEITKGNILIAEFMGHKIWMVKHYIGDTQSDRMEISIKDYDKYVLKGFKYDVYARPFHSDWNLLMPVVEKIRDNNCMVSIRFNRQMNTNNTMIACFEDKWVKDLDISGVGIESTYNAVIKFINWYKEKK